MTMCNLIIINDKLIKYDIFVYYIIFIHMLSDGVMIHNLSLCVIYQLVNELDNFNR